MYHTISQERSLFFIDRHFVNTFKTVAADFSDETLEVETHLYNLENSWTSVFNVWLLLQSDEHLIVECFDKSLYYSVNQLIIKAIKNDYYFKALRANPKHSQELLFITAIYLTNGISHWLKQLLLDNHLDDLATRFYEMNYYDVHQGPPEKVKQFVTDQSRFVKVIAPKLNANGTFNRMLKAQIDKAYFYYHDHYSLNKNHQ